MRGKRLHSFWREEDTEEATSRLRGKEGLAGPLRVGICSESGKQSLGSARKSWEGMEQPSGQRELGAELYKLPV